MTATPCYAHAGKIGFLSTDKRRSGNAEQTNCRPNEFNAKLRPRRTVESTDVRRIMVRLSRRRGSFRRPQDRIKGRTGIVYFSGYWARDTDSHGQTTGDHIDLWNKDTLSSPGLAGRVTSFFRFRMGLSRAWYSDLGKSKEILFWEIK
jgi:hypothetical protein